MSSWIETRGWSERCPLNSDSVDPSSSTAPENLSGNGAYIHNVGKREGNPSWEIEPFKGWNICEYLVISQWPLNLLIRNIHQRQVHHPHRASKPCFGVPILNRNGLTKITRHLRKASIVKEGPKQTIKRKERWCMKHNKPFKISHSCNKNRIL